METIGIQKHSKEKVWTTIGSIIIFMLMIYCIFEATSISRDLDSEWQGTGKVVSNSYEPAYCEQGIAAPVIGAPGAYAGGDSCVPDAWKIKITDEDGNERVKTVTQNFYNKAQVGQSYTWN